MLCSHRLRNNQLSHTYSNNMDNLTSQPRFYALATIVILLNFCIAENAQYNPVSREVIESRLARYTGDNKQREATLEEMFAQAGCDDQHLSEQPVEGSKLPNVICLMPGSSGKVIIVGAHFDHVSEGDGVIDNWSGASLLPSLYEAMRIERHKHTYIFIGFTDEEQGDVGSRFYAKQMTGEQVAATDAMVNMDSLGLEGTKVWAGHSDERLADALTHVATQLNLRVTSVSVQQAGSTDAEPFSERKIPRITIHSLTEETWKGHILHTSKDRLSAVRFDDYYGTYRLLVAYLAFLDQVSNRPRRL